MQFLFVSGASASHVHIHCYKGDIESFAGSDSSLLDDWVFNTFSLFLNNSQRNKTLAQMLRKDKVVFFLHLLGIDTNGHSHKPWSKYNFLFCFTSYFIVNFSAFKD